MRRSKRGRNRGLKQTKMPVTELDEGSPRQVVRAYQHRGPGERIKRERKSAWGWGAHQVRGEEGRIAQSLGIAIVAYVLLIRACHQESLPETSWSLAPLQHTLRLRIRPNVTVQVV